MYSLEGGRGVGRGGLGTWLESWVGGGVTLGNRALFVLILFETVGVLGCSYVFDLCCGVL